MERLQKIIAHAGVSSRRKAEELITTGRVTVNGQVVSELGAKADPEVDHIFVDGKRLKAEQPLYFLFYKPRAVVSTLSDPEGRPTVKDYIAPKSGRGISERLYPVGRLDYHSEGLLLLTNDGDLAHRILHASSEFPKTYWVKVSGRPAAEDVEKLRQGVYLDGRRTAPARIRFLSAQAPELRKHGLHNPSEENPWLEVILIEGRQNQIRRMFARIGHPVEKLKRVKIGTLEIGSLKPGQVRGLTPPELNKLRNALAPAAKNRDAKASASPSTPDTAKRPAKPSSKKHLKPRAKVPRRRIRE